MGLARPVRAWRSGFADSPRSCNIKTSSPRCFCILLSSFPLTALCPVPRPGFCGHRSAAHRRSLSPLISPAVVLQSPSNRFSLHPARVPLFTLLPGRALWCDDRGPWQRRASLIGHAVPLHRCRGGQLERRCNHSEANGTASTPRCPWMRVLPWQRRRRNPGSSDDRAGAQLLARPMTEMPHRERA